MKLVDLVIADVLYEAHSGALTTHLGIANQILDAIHAAGFQIMEPSDKVFNSPDPVVIEDARAAMQAILTNPRYSIKRGPDATPLPESVAEESYAQAYAMKQEREKRYAQLTK